MDIAVEHTLRGKGLAKELMADFLNQCKVRGGQQVFLEVRESNIAAIKLYEKAGFESLERRKNYYQTQSGKENAIIMRLMLSDLS